MTNCYHIGFSWNFVDCQCYSILFQTIHFEIISILKLKYLYKKNINLIVESTSLLMEFHRFSFNHANCSTLLLFNIYWWLLENHYKFTNWFFCALKTNLVNLGYTFNVLHRYICAFLTQGYKFWSIMVLLN